MFEASEFRKLMVDVVCKAGQGLGQKNGVEPETFPLTCQANSTDVRAAAEAAMKAAAGVQQVPAAVVEAHCAHSAFVGQKHYWAHGSKKLHVIYDSVMPGAWCLGRSESGTYTLHQNHFAMCSSSTFVFGTGLWHPVLYTTSEPLRFQTSSHLTLLSVEFQTSCACQKINTK
jgi:hypothetical protein